MSPCYISQFLRHSPDKIRKSVSPWQGQIKVLSGHCKPTLKPPPPNQCPTKCQPPVHYDFVRDTPDNILSQGHLGKVKSRPNHDIAQIYPHPMKFLFKTTRAFIYI